MKTPRINRFKRYLSALSFALIAVFVSTEALADKLPEPTADFSAEMHVDRGGSVQVMKVQRSGDRQRVEAVDNADAKHEKPVMILRKDKKLVWSLFKSSKLYIESPIDDKQEAASKEVDFKLVKVKNETVNGFNTTKYNVTAKSPVGGEMKATMWFTAEGIMVKMESMEKNEGRPDIVVRVELKNLKISKIADSVFEMPEGYNKMMGGPVEHNAGKAAPQSKKDDPLAK